MCVDPRIFVDYFYQPKGHVKCSCGTWYDPRLGNAKCDGCYAKAGYQKCSCGRWYKMFMDYQLCATCYDKAMEGQPVVDG